jgi:superfamily II helicase
VFARSRFRSQTLQELQVLIADAAEDAGLGSNVLEGLVMGHRWIQVEEGTRSNAMTRAAR